MMETALEKILTSSHKPAMIAYINRDPGRFEEAIKLAMADKLPYSWRAAWLLWSCMEKNDRRIRKYVKTMINILPERKDNQKRELLKILELMEIKNEFAGMLFNHCTSIWEDIRKKPAVRFNAFRNMIKITIEHPELTKEVRLLTQKKYTSTLSATVNKSIHKMLAELI